MLVETVIAVGTVSGPGEGLAFGHATQVVFVQILALQPLLAEALEEMFADKRAMCSGWCHPRGGGGRCGDSRRRGVSVWTRRSEWAVAFAVGLADGDIAGEAEAKTLAEEGCE